MIGYKQEFTLVELYRKTVDIAMVSEFYAKKIENRKFSIFFAEFFWKLIILPYSFCIYVIAYSVDKLIDTHSTDVAVLS